MFVKYYYHDHQDGHIIFDKYFNSDIIIILKYYNTVNYIKDSYNCHYDDYNIDDNDHHHRRCRRHHHHMMISMRRYSFWMSAPHISYESRGKNVIVLTSSSNRSFSAPRAGPNTLQTLPATPVLFTADTFNLTLDSIWCTWRGFGCSSNR